MGLSNKQWEKMSDNIHLRIMKKEIIREGNTYILPNNHKLQLIHSKPESEKEIEISFLKSNKRNQDNQVGVSFDPIFKHEKKHQRFVELYAENLPYMYKKEESFLSETFKKLLIIPILYLLWGVLVPNSYDIISKFSFASKLVNRNGIHFDQDGQYNSMKRIYWENKQR